MPVFLKDIWPTRAEVQEVERQHVLPVMFKEVYAKITVGGWGIMVGGWGFFGEQSEGRVRGGRQGREGADVGGGVGGLLQPIGIMELHIHRLE